MAQLVSKILQLVSKMTDLVTVQTIFLCGIVDCLTVRRSPFSRIANTGPTHNITGRPSPPIRSKGTPGGSGSEECRGACKERGRPAPDVPKGHDALRAFGARGRDAPAPWPRMVSGISLKCHDTATAFRTLEDGGAKNVARHSNVESASEEKHDVLPVEIAQTRLRKVELPRASAILRPSLTGVASRETARKTWDAERAPIGSSQKPNAA